MKKKYLLLTAACISAAAVLSACGKNPDSSIVKNKDFDKLIEEAGKDEGKDKSIEDIVPDYDTYKNSFSDESLGVSINVDASVDIPKTDKLSVIRVKQKDISQEFINKFLDNYVKDEKLYDGSIASTRTKSEIEKEISSVKEEMKSISSDDEEVRDEYQLRINELQDEYEQASADRDWDSYTSDKLLYKVDDILKKRNNSFYEWIKGLNPDGDVFYAVNDGKSGDYISVYAQNSDNYGNCFSYRKNKHGYVFNAYQVVSYAPVQAVGYNDSLMEIWKAGDGIPASFKEANPNIAVTEQQDERATISEDKAKEMAADLISTMGMEEFVFLDCGLYCEIPDIRNTDKEEYNTVYIIRYSRKIDETSVTYDAKSKYDEEYKGESFTKKIWPPELIEIRVNDNGIVGFDYGGPLEIMDTVVDKSNMKDFQEIKDTFEKMSIVANANDEHDEMFTNINIDRVVLGYVMISEENSFDTGLMVPAWDFIGKVDYGSKDENGQEVLFKESQYCSVMTINAIDGTVIDRSLGY